MTVSRPSLFTLLSLWFFSFWLAPESSIAQIRASEKASLSQVIDGTKLEIRYSRPSRRGRTPIFGGFVHWGEVWTPGADWATTLTVNKEIKLENTAIPEGTYTVWMALREDNDWELALSEKDSLFHIPHLDLDSAFVRIPVTPARHASEVETLTFLFPQITSTGGTLRMHWGRTFVDMDIKVQSSHRTRITAEEAAPYAGLYDLRILPEPGSQDDEIITTVEFVLENDILWGVVDFGDGDPFNMGLAPVAEHVFLGMWLLEGEVASVYDDLFIEFSVGGSGEVISFQVRGGDDDVWMRGTRSN